MDPLRIPGILSVLLCLIINVVEQSSTYQLLSRKRRYLVFNEGSNFETQVTMSKALLDVNFPSAWNTVLELALQYKLPNTTLRFEKYYKKKPFYYHRRERRDVYQQLERIFQDQGVDGRACILRAICESRALLKPGESLMRDLFFVIFRFPQAENDVSEEYDEAATRDSCDTWASSCPFSIISTFLAVT